MYVNLKKKCTCIEKRIRTTTSQVNIHEEKKRKKNCCGFYNQKSVKYYGKRARFHNKNDKISIFFL